MGVGAFPGINTRRRTVRAPANPMDKSTIFSIFPKHIREIKHTIQPGYFEIKAGTPENPTQLVVGSSSWWKEIDAEQPLLEIPNGSVQVAESVVKDYCNGLLGCNMSTSMPGLFWMAGEISLQDLRTKHKLILEKAGLYQRNYFHALIKLADSLWARTNGNPLVISDDMRLAAKQLNLNNKDWMKDFSAMNQVRCTSCGSLRNPEFPVCPTCKAVVDVEKATALGLKFVQ